MDPRTTTHTDLAPTILVIAWLFAGLAIILVFVRFWIRTKVLKSLSIDDWTILITLALALVNSSLTSVSVWYGLGKHTDTLSAKNISETIKWSLLSSLFGIMSPCIGRISFALLLLKITPSITWRRRLLWTIIGCQFAIDVVTAVVGYCQCQPMAKFWNPELEGTCLAPQVQQYVGYFQGSFCSLVDLTLAIFPASLFWRLQMDLRIKISLSILMGLGFIAMIASIVKTVELRNLTDVADITYNLAILVIWYTLEGYLVLIGASIPTLKALFLRKERATTGLSHTNNILNTWRSSQLHSKSRSDKKGSISLDERPFFELSNTQSRSAIASV